jgi:hypothetical protein
MFLVNYFKKLIFWFQIIYYQMINYLNSYNESFIIWFKKIIELTN